MESKELTFKNTEERNNSNLYKCYLVTLNLMELNVNLVNFLGHFHS